MTTTGESCCSHSLAMALVAPLALKLPVFWKGCSKCQTNHQSCYYYVSRHCRRIICRCSCTQYLALEERSLALSSERVEDRAREHRRAVHLRANHSRRLPHVLSRHAPISFHCGGILLVSCGCSCSGALSGSLLLTSDTNEAKRKAMLWRKPRRLWWLLLVCFAAETQFCVYAKSPLLKPLLGAADPQNWLHNCT